MQRIVLSTFRGVNLNENAWKNGQSKYAKGVDFYGLNNSLKKMSFVGTLQAVPRMKRMEQGSSPFVSAVAGLEFYPATFGDLYYMYAIDNIAGQGNIYRLSANGGNGTDEWQKVSAAAVSGTGCNLKAYNGNLYYATLTHVGQFDNTTWTATWNVLSDQLNVPRPMEIFSGSLFIGNGRYIAKYDGTTFSGTKLTLPSGFIVRSLAVYKDRLFFTADNRSESRFGYWDGVSPTYDDFLPLSESYGLSLCVSNGVLWGVSNRGLPSTDRVELVNQVYVFNGDSFDPTFLLPIKRSNDFNPVTAVAPYKTGILVGSCETNTSSQFYEEGSGGLWYLGQDADGTYHASLLFPEAQSGVTGINSDALYTGQQYFLSASTRYTLPVIWAARLVGAPAAIIDHIDTKDFYAYTSSVWQSLPIDADDSSVDKTWHDLKFDIESDVSSTDSVTIYYRLNYATSWSTLKTITSASVSKMLVPVRKTAKVIEFKIEVNASSSRGTRVHSAEVRYDPLTR